jgi:hypothetical protein
MLGCRSEEKTSIKFATIPTSVVLTWDSAQNLLNTCAATLENNRLNLHIEQKPDSIANYAVEIFQNDSGFDIAVSQPWSITESSYVAPRFKILKQELKLNQSHYQSNDLVKGDLRLLLLGHKSYFREHGEMKLREDWDTIHCSGVFSAIVK